jgi:phage shock protein C
MSSMNTRLTRSRTDKFLGGVCGGLARSLGIDPSIVRIAVILLAVLTKVGWIAYLVAWALLPQENGGSTGIDDARKLFDTWFGRSTATPHADVDNGNDLR